MIGVVFGADSLWIQASKCAERATASLGEASTSEVVRLCAFVDGLWLVTSGRLASRMLNDRRGDRSWESGDRGVAIVRRMAAPHDAAAADGPWLPLAGAFTPSMLAGIAAMQDGLQRAGFTVLAEMLGLPELPVSLLRVKTPHASIEAAERWLLHQLQPHAHEAWADGLSFWLAQAWREYHLLSGTVEEIEALAQRIRVATAPSFLPSPVVVTEYPELDGSLSGPSSRRHLGCFARTALEVVRLLPEVRALGPEPVGDPRRWLAIEVAHEPRQIAELEACGRGFEALGFSTCRYTWRDGASALLAIEAGDAMWDELEVQIAARLPKAPAAQPAWLRPYKPWS